MKQYNTSPDAKVRPADDRKMSETDSLISVWASIPVDIRTLLLAIANMAPERAPNPLHSFTRRERFVLAAHATVLERRIADAKYCILAGLSVDSALLSEAN